MSQNIDSTKTLQKIAKTQKWLRRETFFKYDEEKNWTKLPKSDYYMYKFKEQKYLTIGRRPQCMSCHKKSNYKQKTGQIGRKNGCKRLSICALLAKTLFNVEKSFTTLSAWSKKLFLAQKKISSHRNFTQFRF